MLVQQTLNFRVNLPVVGGAEASVKVVIPVVVSEVIAVTRTTGIGLQQDILVLHWKQGEEKGVSRA
jgi:hypothetical protein